ncbi:hypothetical protein ES703_124217 [subsurface metagenome]
MGAQLYVRGWRVIIIWTIPGDRPTILWRTCYLFLFLLFLFFLLLFLFLLFLFFLLFLLFLLFLFLLTWCCLTARGQH